MLEIYKTPEWKEIKEKHRAKYGQCPVISHLSTAPWPYGLKPLYFDHPTSIRKTGHYHPTKNCRTLTLRHIVTCLHLNEDDSVTVIRHRVGKCPYKTSKSRCAGRRK